MSNRTNLSASYNYTVTAAPDNSAYLWSGHGLENAPNPTIYIRSDDDITITNTSGGHIMSLTADFVAWGVTESNGQIVLVSDPGLFGEGKYTYVCTSHPVMTGKLIVSNVVADGGPEDGYGTGPLPETQNAIKMDAIRTKINEIVTKGGIGGGSISVSDTPPDNPSEGDLWFDETAAALYVWIGDPTNSWIQTSGGGSGSIDVSNTAPTSPAEGDLWFNTTEGQLYVYVASETAWIQTNGGGGGGGSGEIEWLAPATPLPLSEGWRSLSSAGLPEDTAHMVIYYSTRSLATGTSSIQVAISDNGTPGGAADYDSRTMAFNDHPTGVTIYSGQFIAPVITDRNGERGYWIYPENIAQIDVQGIIRSGGGTAGGASVTTGDTAPASPSDGNLWFNTTEAELYVYVDAEGAWVQTNGGGGGGGISDVQFFENGEDPVPVQGWNTLESLGLPANTTQIVVFCRSNLLNQQTGTVEIATGHDGTNYIIRYFFACHHYLDRSCSQFIAPVITNHLGETGILIGWTNMDTIRFEGYMTSGSGGGGPRAYVAFDGTAADMTTELSGANSLNVSSITDHGAGDYTINYTNPVSQPIISIGYQVRASSPFHALYWGIIDQTDSYARIGLGSNNVYYDHPYVSFIAH